MKARVLLVNPPIYDFTAYDFWLKPYGMLSVAGMLRGSAEMEMFDFLDRADAFMASRKWCKSDRFGRGRFYEKIIPKPAIFSDIPRHYRRFGRPRESFRDFLQSGVAFEVVLIQTTMTYWYPGVEEVIADIRRYCPGAKIVLGGNYASICEEHARGLGADELVIGSDIEPLWKMLGFEGDQGQPAYWEVYPKLRSGVIRISDGCPFKCTYCAAPKFYDGMTLRPLEKCLAEFELLRRQGVSDIAFYDDALLYKPEEGLVPFLEAARRVDDKVNFHTPNGLNARFVTGEVAELLVKKGFKTFYLGFESVSFDWQKETGAKVFSEELVAAVENLVAAGAEKRNITAYQIVGHPKTDTQKLEGSLNFVHGLGIRGMLADFSPIPGTVDGESCRQWVDLDEPLLHNKSAFPAVLLGFENVNYLKGLQRKLNRSLG